MSGDSIIIIGGDTESAGSLPCAIGDTVRNNTSKPVMLQLCGQGGIVEDVPLAAGAVHVITYPCYLAIGS